MPVVAWSVVVVAGFAVSVVASSRTVTYASALVTATRLPPFVVGLTLLAVGTDLPEIANSVVASAAGHGDLNVGDSVGSAATQATLVLGLLPFLGGALATPGRRPYVTGLLAALSLGVVAVVVADDQLSRADGAVLISLWLAGTWLVYRLLGRTLERDVEAVELDGVAARYSTAGLAGRTFLGLAFVGAGATLAVIGAIQISEELGLSEFLISFFALSIGTSMPELVLALTAARRGESALAVGDILGSSFADTTLSVGIGPLLFPVAVTSSEILPALLPAALAIVAVTLMLIRVERHERATGAFALALYALFYVVVL